MIQVNSTPLKPIPTSNAYLGPLGLTMPTYYLFNMRGQVKEISFSDSTAVHSGVFSCILTYRVI